MKNFKLTGLTIIVLLAISSCSKKDDPAPVNEEEVITTVVATMSNAAGNVVLTSKDADGNGPAAAMSTQIGNIVAGRVYIGAVKFLNELKNPADDITPEILTEGADHQLFFQANSTVGAFTYEDTDANGKPIGLKFKFTAAVANAMQQNLTVTLRHLPNKSAAGVSTGNIGNAAGATDAEVLFKLVVNP